MITQTPMNAAGGLLRVRTFMLWAYLAALGFACGFVLKTPPSTGRAWGFATAAALTYAMFYTLPVVVAGLACRPLLRRGWLAQTGAAVVMVTMASAMQLGLAADYVIHRMFGFHINGFVINLITTPEGITSMGADDGASRVYLLVAVFVVAVNAVAWWVWVRSRLGHRVSAWITGRRMVVFIVALVALALGERVTYGLGHIKAWSDVMAVASSVPVYQPATFRGLAKALGIKGERRIDLGTSRDQGVLAYPARSLETGVPAKKLNIVWLVCESLRADMLTPEIMPRTWAFARESSRFTRHYSGGNGTRMGMFTLFYGVPGSYWFDFLGNRRSPVFMDRLQELGYQLHLSTSAAFSYPEFDKTMFVHVPAAQMYAAQKGEGWESDRHHVARIKAWLEKERGAEPFFLFHFFESSHARYYFPPETVIRRPYLEDFNYATTNIRRDIELIRNRYINAVHHLDTQLGEVLDALRAQNLLDDTVVMITGDHGEEFMEAGNWGHNSQFTEQQIRVPLVLHVPGRAPAVIDHPTSHLDLVSTLVPMLGVKNATEDYSTGEPLFSDAPRLLTFADWDRIAFSDGRYKAIFPIKTTSSQVGSRLTTADDRPVEDEAAKLREQGPAMTRLMKMLNRFKQRP